jgi:hypothetical protein
MLDSLLTLCVLFSTRSVWGCMPTQSVGAINAREKARGRELARERPFELPHLSRVNYHIASKLPPTPAAEADCSIQSRALRHCFGLTPNQRLNARENALVSE